MCWRPFVAVIEISYINQTSKPSPPLLRSFPNHHTHPRTKPTYVPSRSDGQSAQRHRSQRCPNSPCFHSILRVKRRRRSRKLLGSRRRQRGDERNARWGRSRGVCEQWFDIWRSSYFHSRTGAGLEKRGVGGSGVVAGSSSSDLLTALSPSFSSSCTVVDVGLGAELKALIVLPP